jgi:D-sedoheptulose 7-phosphate isomerase
LTTRALTGPAPNPLAHLADDALCVEAARTATVQEIHQIVVHLLCGAVDRAVGRLGVELRVGSTERLSDAAR